MDITTNSPDFGAQDRKRPGRRRRLIVGLLAVMAMLVGFTSPADARPRVEISGNATPSDCNDGEGVGAIELTGDLQGCLVFFPTSFTCAEYNGFALYEEAGRETFRGTYDGRRGKFKTQYTLAATYTSGSCAEFEAGGFPYLNQLTGGCDHTIHGKLGAFKGRRGFIQFFDIIPDPGTSGASNFYYAGWLR